MDFSNQLVLAGAVLLLAILASALSYRIGMPLLLVFLAVGMLAGEDGPGGILFDDSGIAYTVGSVALAIILLDGGLNTRSDSFRAGLRPASVLATVGVLVTCVVTGLFAAWMLGFGLLEGLLVGAVVGSTDAAAVFALLHAKGLALKQRVSATLEIESGSNDPMAALLTIALIELILSGQPTPGWETLVLFVQQMGMYPMLVLAGGLALYSLTTVLGGSGFSPPTWPAWWSATAPRANRPTSCRCTTAWSGWRRSPCSSCWACSPPPAICSSMHPPPWQSHWC